MKRQSVEREDSGKERVMGSGEADSNMKNNLSSLLHHSIREHSCVRLGLANLRMTGHSRWGEGPGSLRPVEF